MCQYSACFMRHPQRPSPTPDGTEPTPVRGNLPAELSTFVGREAELAELESLLGESRLVTVVGVAGVGKTRITARVAALMEKRYCDGVWIAELSDVHDPELLVHTLVDALGLTDHTSRSPRAVLAEHCAERRLMLVIDGFEHLAGPCAELVRELLRRAPGLRVLAAGRRPLRVEGEVTFPLLPMTDDDALELFVRRACAVRPDFRLPGGDRETALELCRRLDGIPLALELAAGRLRALTTEQVLHRLDDRFRLLTGGSPARSPGIRHCARPSAGATSCALQSSGCCGRGSRCSPGSSTWRPSSTSAAAWICPPTRCSTCWTNCWRSPWCCARTRPSAAATGCWTPCGSTAPSGCGRPGTPVGCAADTGTGTWAWQRGANSTGSAPDRRRPRRGSTANYPISAARWSARWRARTRSISRSTWQARCGSTGRAAGASQRAATGWTTSWRRSPPTTTRD